MESRFLPAPREGIPANWSENVQGICSKQPLSIRYTHSQPALARLAHGYQETVKSAE